ncbi:MAG: DUF1343 domain-containing protein, partial [Myxococcota bacterium]
GGVQIHVTERERFLPYRTGVAFVHAIHRLYPEHFAWRREAYEFVSDVPAIDLLTGSPAVREGIEAGAELAELAATWRAAEQRFADERADWLLYR